SILRPRRPNRVMALAAAVEANGAAQAGQRLPRRARRRVAQAATSSCSAIRFACGTTIAPPDDSNDVTSCFANGPYRMFSTEVSHACPNAVTAAIASPAAHHARAASSHNRDRRYGPGTVSGSIANARLVPSLPFDKSAATDTPWISTLYGANAVTGCAHPPGIRP